MYKNIEAEQAVLGSCLVDETALEATAETLLPKDFYETKHKNLYKTILKLLSNNITVDIVTVSSEYSNGNLESQIGGIGYMTKIINSVPTVKNIEHYISLVKKCFIKREQKNLLTAVEDGQIEIDGAISELEKLNISAIPEETFSMILENTLLNTLKGTEWTFGIQTFNKYLGGLDKGELLTIGGYTSQGKSDLAIQMAINQAKRGHKVLFLSTEMLTPEIGRRILSNMTSVRVMDLRKGLLSEDEREELELCSHEIGKSWKMNMKKIFSIEDVTKYVRKYKPELLFLDYIQNLSGEEDYKSATRNIKILQEVTRRYELGTVCVSQLNRNNKNGDEITREPRLSDLRNTGRIEECSNMVMFVYWKDRLLQKNIARQGGEPPEEPEVLILKNRDGTIGRFPVHFYPEYARVCDVLEEEYQQEMDYHDMPE